MPSSATTRAERGAFISIEGIDGAGKSTQSRALAEMLRARGHAPVMTREPGGAPGAEDIRRLLVEGEPEKWSPETEILLFTAARRDHVEKLITPTLEAGGLVISDRFADSTRVYQGAVRASLRGMVDALHSLMIGIEPDLTLIIDMDPELALKRGLSRQSGEDRFEDFGLEFQQALRAGFVELAREFPKRCRLIDGNRAAEEIAADLSAITSDWLDGRA